MSRRRPLIDHGLVFAAALFTLPLALFTGEAVGPLIGGAVIIAGLWVAVAATLRLASVTALIPTVAAMGLSCCALVFAALSDPSPSCDAGRTGFTDGCVAPPETIAVWLVVFFIVLTGVLCFLQLLATPLAAAARTRLPPTARLPMDDAWHHRDRGLVDERDSHGP